MTLAAMIPCNIHKGEGGGGEGAIQILSFPAMSKLVATIPLCCNNVMRMAYYR